MATSAAMAPSAPKAKPKATDGVNTDTAALPSPGAASSSTGSGPPPAMIITPLPDELLCRLRRCQSMMRQEGIGALLLTTEPLFHYFSGYQCQFWKSPTRPIFLIIPGDADRFDSPIAVLPECCHVGFREQCGAFVPEENSLHWPAPRPEDDGVSDILKVLKERVFVGEFGKQNAKLGMPMGHETSLRMPLRDFERVRAGLLDSETLPVQTVDATVLLRAVRRIKTEYEVSVLRRACAMVNRAFDEFPREAEREMMLRAEKVAAGLVADPDGRDASAGGLDSAIIDEKDFSRWMRRRLLAKGVDSVPYLIANSGGTTGVTSIVEGPYDGKVLVDTRRGAQFNAEEPDTKTPSVFAFDTGCRLACYHTDFTRNYVFLTREEAEAAPGSALRLQADARNADLHRANEALWQATQAALDLLGKSNCGLRGQKGKDVVRFCDIHAVMDRAIKGVLGGEEDSNVGRMGHELGLELTEGHSVAPWDEKELEPGMIITLEPSCVVNAARDPDGILVHEDNLVIREEGYELFTKRAPRRLPIIRWPGAMPVQKPAATAATSCRAAAAADADSTPGAAKNAKPAIFNAPSRVKPALKFSKPPRAALGFVQLPSDFVFEQEAPGLVEQIPGVAWRGTKMNFAPPPAGGATVSKTYSDASTTAGNAGNYSSGSDADGPDLGVICAESYVAAAERSRAVERGAGSLGGPGLFSGRGCDKAADSLPGYGGIDVLALSCTSMSISLGETFVENELRSGFFGGAGAVKRLDPDGDRLKTTNMFKALVNALTAVNNNAASGASGGDKKLRLAVLTPYSDRMHADMVASLQKGCGAWLDVIASDNLGIDRDTSVSAIAPSSIVGRAKFLVETVEGPAPDCVLLCCSALRVTGPKGFLDGVEQQLGGAPVLTSNQAMIWESLHLAAAADKIGAGEVRDVEGYGQLFGMRHPVEAKDGREGGWAWTYSEASVGDADREVRVLEKIGTGAESTMIAQPDAQHLLERFLVKQQAVKAFHADNQLEVTPLISLRSVAQELGIDRVLMKDEGRRMGLKAFKGVGVGFALDQAITRAGGPDRFFVNGNPAETTLTTMTDGNHGRAVAHIAGKMGCKAIIYVPQNMAEARKAALEEEGAEVVVVSGSYDDAIAEVKERSARLGHVLISDTAWPGYEEIPADICAGYGSIFREVEEEVAREKNWSGPITHLVLQCGVGGFASAGVAYAYWNRGDKAGVWAKDLKIILVEPTDADCISENARATHGNTSEAGGEKEPYLVDPASGLRLARGQTDSVMSGLNCGVPSSTAWPVLRDLTHAYVACGDAWAKEAVRRLAAADSSEGEEAVVAGESGAAGLAGVRAALSMEPNLKGRLGLTKDSVVLFVNTEADTDPELYRRIVEGNV